MPSMVNVLLIAVRVLAVAELVLGAVLWLGRSVPGRGVHLTIGGLLGLAVLALGAVAARRTGRASALLVAAGWTALLVAYGVGHARLLPGGAHWVAQVVHVLIGLATIGVAERVAGDGRRAVV